VGWTRCADIILLDISCAIQLDLRQRYQTLVTSCSSTELRGSTQCLIEISTIIYTFTMMKKVIGA
jgi:hypothetical protein